MAELTALQQGAEAFAQTVSFPFDVGEYKGLTPCEGRTAKLAFLLSELSVEPKLSHIDALKLARRAGQCFLQIMEAIDRLSSIEIQLEEVSGMESLKNESSGTSSTETD